jgi:hypothetical protein
MNLKFLKHGFIIVKLDLIVEHSETLISEASLQVRRTGSHVLSSERGK